MFFVLARHSLFPVGLNVSWHTASAVTVPEACLQNWLLDTGSLTERLQSQCRRFFVDVLGQAPMDITPEEARALSGSADTRWQVREVLLLADDIPWVFARSVIPHSLCENDLAGLGNQPLGKIIFNDDRFIREPFQLCHASLAPCLTSALEIPPKLELWGRRSVFAYEGVKMMVAEVFLPDSPAYVNSRLEITR